MMQDEMRTWKYWALQFEKRKQNPRPDWMSSTAILSSHSWEILALWDVHKFGISYNNDEVKLNGRINY